MGEMVEVDSKGRIVIPSSIRSRFGLNAGAQLVVDIRNDEVVLSRIVTGAIEQVKDTADSLKDFLSKD